MKGCYALVIKIDQNKSIQIGKLNKIFFKKGYYVYIGSALNNLEKRITRHKKIEKKFHWHIDYLLQTGKIIDVYYKKTEFKEECIIANNFQTLNQIKNFGSSDCKCNSHLFFGNLNEINTIIRNLGLKKFKTL
jgi:Uri superfamily endonuclease